MTQEEKDDLEVKTPFGSVRAGGRHISFLVILVLVGAFLAFMVRDHDLRAATRASVLELKITELAATQREALDGLQTLAYISTLTDTQRRALNLGMPEGLRKQLLKQERSREPHG